MFFFTSLCFLMPWLMPNCSKVHNTISVISSQVIPIIPISSQFNTIKNKAMNRIATITVLGLMPVRSSLWWKWFLSGIKGFLPSRIRCITTLTTSNNGTMSVEKANTKLTCPASPPFMSIRLRWMTSRLMI